MMEKKVYIKSFSRISVLDGEPDCKAFLTPMEARRMSRMMKRAVFVSMTALQKAGIGSPDAIVTGTGLGCLENTEAFLKSLTGVNDLPLRPTSFMQSTHNTISSMIAIRTGCHGYNATYSHLGTSFESAMLDGLLQIRSGSAANVLACAFEELTPDFSRMLEKTGFGPTVKDGRLSETAVAMVLSSDPQNAICELSSVKLGRSGIPMPEGFRIITRDDAISSYGNNFSVSALAVCDGALAAAEGEKSLIYNNFSGYDQALTILLPPCGN
jgi:hypothetical protein